jgi:hypothetical protein
LGCTLEQSSVIAQFAFLADRLPLVINTRASPQRNMDALSLRARHRAPAIERVLQLLHQIGKIVSSNRGQNDPCA